MSSPSIQELAINVKMAHTYNNFCKITWINGESMSGWVVDALVEVEAEDGSIVPAFLFITTKGAIGGVAINKLITHFQHIKCIGSEDKLGEFAAAYGYLLVFKKVEVSPGVGDALIEKIEHLNLRHHVNFESEKTTIRLED